jgi:DNA-binding PadR family transcriptional regulator
MFASTICSTGEGSGCRSPRHGGGRGFAHSPRGEFGGHGGFGGHRGGGHRRGRARRGDIRTAALLLLAEEPRNGYQIMQEVQERSNGMWNPSPGSVYPALAQLEDEGLITTGERDGRKVFAITDAGLELVEERGSERAAPWEQQDVGGGVQQLAGLMREVGFAFVQVMKTGGSTQIEKAGEVLAATRRDLYRILADGDLGEAASDKGAGKETPETGGDAGTVDGDS